VTARIHDICHKLIAWPFDNASQAACPSFLVLQLSEQKKYSSDKALRISVEETLHLGADWSKFSSCNTEKCRNPLDLNE
jgi:hypothetical protein